MLLLKKILIANVLGAGIITPIVKYTRHQTPIEKLELENTLKKWNQLFSKISGKTDFEKLSNLFSRNLTSFSKSAVINTVKQLLMQWVIQIWENQEAFFPISQRLNKFFFYYHIHHWKMKNEVEELSWDLIKQFFIDFFFKEKGWFLLSQFGDFSSFVLEEWEKKEKPMKIHEWTFKYSNAEENKQVSSDSESLYSRSTMERVKNRIPFLFPEIKGSEEYSSFISKLTHRGEVELSKFKKRWVTLSELTKLTDGYKLGALIHLYKQQGSYENEEETSGGAHDGSVPTLKLKGNNNDSRDPSKNPLFLFLDKRQDGNCLLIHNALFNEESKKQEETSCLYSARWLSKESEDDGNEGGKNQRVLASREQEGISFYYLSGDSKLRGQGEGKTIDEQDTEVIEKVTKYLTENFETIFFQYLLSKGGMLAEESEDSVSFSLQPINKNTSQKIKDWNFSNFLKKHSEVLLASSNYLESLYWAQTLKTLQTILLSVYKYVPEKIEIKDEHSESITGRGTRIQLPDTSGLFSPLTHKRTDSKEENKELDFFDLRAKENESSGEQEFNNHKNWFFDELIEFLFGKEKDKKLFSLKEKADELKELLLRKGDESLFRDFSLKDFFSNNLFFRAQLEDLSGSDNTNSVPSIFTLKAEEIIFPKSKQVTEEGNDSFSSLLNSYINSLEKKGGEQEKGARSNNTPEWKDLINESIFLEPFLKSSIDQKIFYGTLDIEDPTTKSSEQKIESEDSNSKKKLITKARNHWLLNNYYFSDSAYESSSEEYKEFLSYLLAVKWMVEKDYANLPHLINRILKKNKNRNAYLFWFREITEQEKDKLAEEQTTVSKPAVTSASSDSLNSSTSPKEQLKKLLEETFSTDISNPLLKGGFVTDADEEGGGSSENGNGSPQEPKTKDYSSKNIMYSADAYKDKDKQPKENQDKLTKLSGFAGLITESFSTREIPRSLKDYIFKNFLNSNSSKNTNYSSEKQTLPVQEISLVEGAFYPSNTKRKLKDNSELLSLLEKITKKEILLKFLDSESVHSLKIALDKQEENINNLTLKELKDELIKSLNQSNSLVSDQSETSQDSKLIKELYRLFNRFSGYLWVSDNREKSNHVFTETKENSNEKKYYIGFLYQVNQFDFEKEGIKELKESLSEQTLHTLISLLASNKEIREWIYDGILTRQLFLS